MQQCVVALWSSQAEAEMHTSLAKFLFRFRFMLHSIVRAHGAQ